MRHKQSPVYRKIVLSLNTVLLCLWHCILGGCTSVTTQLEQDIPYQENFTKHDLTLTQPITSQLQDLATELVSENGENGFRHYAGVVEIGEDALLARLHLIASAQSAIDIQTFIWIDDEVGRLLYEELLKAARRGVRVRVLIDQLIPACTPEDWGFMATAHPNLQYRLFKPLQNRAVNRQQDLARSLVFGFRHLNRRMHNKMLLIDQRIGIIGGRNIENKYFDFGNKFNFKDREVIVIGSEVKKMAALFNLYWSHKWAVAPTQLDDVQQALIQADQNSTELTLSERNLEIFSDLRNRAQVYTITAEAHQLELLHVDRLEFFGDSPVKPSRGERKKKLGQHGTNARVG